MIVENPRRQRFERAAQKAYSMQRKIVGDFTLPMETAATAFRSFHGLEEETLAIPQFKQVKRPH